MGKGRDSVEAIRNAGTGSSPAGGQFEIQFNDGGDFAADVSFGYNSAVKRMYADKIQSADPDAGAAGEFLATFDAAGDLNKSAKTVDDISPTPAAGNSNEIQYNTGGIFAASSTFKRDAITGRIDLPFLRVTGIPLSIDNTEKITSVTATGDIKKSSISLADVAATGNKTILFNTKSTSGVTNVIMNGTDLDFMGGAPMLKVTLRAIIIYSATVSPTQDLRATFTMDNGSPVLWQVPLVNAGAQTGLSLHTEISRYEPAGVIYNLFSVSVQNLASDVPINCDSIKFDVEAIPL